MNAAAASPAYEPYGILQETVAKRVRSVLAPFLRKNKQQQQLSSQKSKSHETRRSIPGGRATLDEESEVEDNGSEDDEPQEGYVGLAAEEPDGLEWEHEENPLAPDEPLVAFRNLSVDLIPTPHDAETTLAAAALPHHGIPSADQDLPLSSPHRRDDHENVLLATLEQLDAEFSGELAKSRMRVELQQKYMTRRHASGEGADPGRDLVAVLLDMIKGMRGEDRSGEEHIPGEVEEGRDEGEDEREEEGPDDHFRTHGHGTGGFEGLEATRILLGRLQRNLDRSPEAVTPLLNLNARAAPEFSRFMPTTVPSFGMSFEE
ncbi:hypothetical protein HKX48_006719 [Thoreauomyces humboldtii]|nr:hypothetical protein HKX48_006719 [Thoreauomyces humboldtii]